MNIETLERYRSCCLRSGKIGSWEELAAIEKQSKGGCGDAEGKDNGEVKETPQLPLCSVQGMRQRVQHIGVQATGA